MKIKSFILIATLSLCLLSCKYLGFKSDKEEEANEPPIELSGKEMEALLTLPKTKAFYTGLLESFFQQHYSECFKGSTYKEGTCSVIKLVFSGEEASEEGDSAATAKEVTKKGASDGQDEVEVVGTHTYVGPAGYDVTGQKFKAIISIAEEGFNIDLYRESTQILTSKSFWEQGAGNFIYAQ